MPDSRAPYIIICNGRIEVSTAKTNEEKIKAASNAAMNLTVFYSDRVTAEETAAISDLQHEMMDNLHTWSKDQVNTKVADMFTMLDALEDAHEG